MNIYDKMHLDAIVFVVAVQFNFLWMLLVISQIGHFMLWLQKKIGTMKDGIVYA